MLPATYIFHICATHHPEIPFDACQSLGFCIYEGNKRDVRLSTDIPPVNKATQLNSVLGAGRALAMIGWGLGGWGWRWWWWGWGWGWGVWRWDGHGYGYVWGGEGFQFGVKRLRFNVGQAGMVAWQSKLTRHVMVPTELSQMKNCDGGLTKQSHKAVWHAIVMYGRWIVCSLIFFEALNAQVQASQNSKFIHYPWVNQVHMIWNLSNFWMGRDWFREEDMCIILAMSQ